MSGLITTKSSMHVAVVGCGHGTLNNIYASIKQAAKLKEWPRVDLVIIGGDFQAVRNDRDLNGMSVPMKYRQLGDFHEYYARKRVAPYLTIFVGGNHEASNHMAELYYGGWVAPNIYYLGAAGVIRCGSLRIAGLSGIWKGYDYRKPHHEQLPYSRDTCSSAYHVREIDTRKLLQLQTPVDIGLSHDWPKGIEWLGDWRRLFRCKPDFQADARSGRLGSVAARAVLDHMRPRYWFAAHLHCEYSAIVDHTDQHPHTNGHSAAVTAEEPMQPENTTSANADEIEIDLDDLDDEGPRDQAAARTEANSVSNLATGSKKASSPPDAATSNSIGGEGLGPQESEDGKGKVSDDLRAQLPESFQKTSANTPASAKPHPDLITNKITRFLALDKCLPRRHFLKLVDIASVSDAPQETGTELTDVKKSTDDAASRSERVSEAKSQITESQENQPPYALSYDSEWLAILRVFAREQGTASLRTFVPPDRGAAYYVPRIAAEEAWVRSHILPERMKVPLNFEWTAPIQGGPPNLHNQVQPESYKNPQTRAFCKLLDIAEP